ncbi:MAG: ABC transporter permease [Gracilibacteraceae bacterium]|jgi:ABC-2 type transport system permease protein|nr:ABC transporter permease [Gracilibacteraceae bacterium]
MMNNIVRVARWELLRNLRSKTFLISLLLTPVIIAVFSALPSLITFMAAEEPFTLYIYDEYDFVDQLKPMITSEIVLVVENDPAQPEPLVRETPRSGYAKLDAASIQAKTVQIWTYSEGELGFNNFGGLPAALQSLSRTMALGEHGLNELQIAEISRPFTVVQESLNPHDKDADPFKKYIPAILAGILYINMFISAMLMYTSVMQEKKDRMAEIILSSISARQFMQGKIFGYFLLSLIQVALWLAIAIPVVINFLQIPVLAYLATWQIIPIVLFVFSGYLLYFSCFAAVGATIEDAHSSTNFQTIIFMLPMLPLFCFGPVLVNPNGSVALLFSYIPFTSPLILPLRAALTNSIPLTQYLVSGAILAATCFLIMVVSGKIFRASILLYGRNVSLGDLVKGLGRRD